MPARSLLITFMIVFGLSLQLRAEPLLLTVEQAREQAVLTSPGLAKMRARLEEAKGVVAQARSGGNPKIELQGRYTFLSPELDFASPSGAMPIVVNNNFQASLVLEQTIATFGRLRWGKQAAELQLASLEQELERRRQAVEYEAAVVYSTLQTARQQIEVSQASLKAREQFLEDLKKREKAGTSAGFEVLVAEVARAQEQQNLVLAEQHSELALSRLLVLLALPAERPIATVPLEEVDEPEIPSAAEAFEVALAQRLELKAVDLAIEAAQAKIHFEESHDRPYLGFQTRYDQRTSTAFQTPNQWAVGLQLNVPLYDGGLSRAKVMQSEAVKQQLQESRRELERQIRLEVEESIVRCRTSAQNLEVGQRTLVSALETARLAELRFRLGVGTYQEVLDAQARSREAQQGVFEARQRIREARWQLEFAQGGLFQGGSYDEDR